jgi:predicted acetyltransferase
LSIEIRALTPDDHFRHRELMSHAFSGGRVQTPPAPDAPPPSEDDVKGSFGLFENGDLRAAYSIVPYRAHWGQNGVQPVGGIAGVATWAEARGRGHVGALLRHSLEVQRDAGQALSALYPFAWAFYRRFGWEWVGEKRHVTLPLGEVRSGPEGKNVHEVRGNDENAVRETLAPIYTTFARRYRGVFDTETTRWGNRLRHSDNKRTYAYIHQSPGQDPDGYLLWRYEGGDNTGRVREFVANTPEAYRGLLSLLHYFGTQPAKAKIVTLPADHQLWNHVMHWDVETRTSPVFMGRVVDVAGALGALRPGSDVSDGACSLPSPTSRRRGTPEPGA